MIVTFDTTGITICILDGICTREGVHEFDASYFDRAVDATSSTAEWPMNSGGCPPVSFFEPKEPIPSL